MPEKQLLKFMHGFAFFVTEEELQKSLDSVRLSIQGVNYRKGMFFKEILNVMDRSIDWRFAEHMEDAFVESLDKKRIMVEA
ncbi:MAG TPA: hypothetical protein VI979_00420 [archaeon]|nr:hypothetical protein [archaeon]